MSNEIKKILSNMPKFSAEPIDIDGASLEGNYEFIVDLLNSQQLTEDELKWRKAVEHYMTCDNPKHAHGIVETYFPTNPELQSRGEE